MVRTGVRGALLLDALTATGLEPIPNEDAPPRPHLAELPDATAAEVLALYRALGGALDAPTLRPGEWDMSFRGGLVVELDEELLDISSRKQLAAALAADPAGTASKR